MEDLKEKISSTIHNWGNFDLDFVKVFEFDQEIKNPEKSWLVRSALIEPEINLEDIPTGIQTDIRDFGKGYFDRKGDLKFECSILGKDVHFEPLAIEQGYLDDHDISLEYIPVNTFISFYDLRLERFDKERKEWVEPSSGKTIIKSLHTHEEVEESKYSKASLEIDKKLLNNFLLNFKKNLIVSFWYEETYDIEKTDDLEDVFEIINEENKRIELKVYSYNERSSGKKKRIMRFEGFKIVKPMLETPYEIEFLVEY